MKRKHAITTAVVVLILGTLIYLQFRTWQSFDWRQFWAQTRNVDPWMILISIILTYLVYVLRAIRWAIFLRPTKKTSVKSLIVPQFIGFTGLALLGRPGEFVRPYMIARRENLSFPSQLAVWAVERVFDMGSVAVLLGLTLAIAGGKYERFPQVKEAGFAMLFIAAGVALAVFLLWWKTDAIASLAQRLFSRVSKRVADIVCRKVTSFGEGLHTLQDFKSFLAVLGLSVCIWLMIAQAYIHVMHAYPQETITVQNGAQAGETRVVRLHEMKLEDVLLVMGASMAGSVVQLPGVGGGSQLAVISLLSSDIFRSEPYNISRELAVSCGMMLWLVTFMSVIPFGLILAHFNRISLRELGAESVQAER